MHLKTVVRSLLLIVLVPVISSCGQRTFYVEPKFGSPTPAAARATQTPAATRTAAPADHEGPAVASPTPRPTLTPAPSPAPTQAEGEGASGDPLADEGAIRAALAAHLGAREDDLTVVVAENTGTHARGGVDNGYFLAVQIDGGWAIVADGQGALDCPALAPYGFPPAMVPECR